MRVLLSVVTAKHTDFAFAEILRRVEAEHCGVIFGDLKTPDKYPEISKFTEFAFSHAECRRALYAEQPFYAECPPLEPALIEQMAPYERDIFYMLRRERPVDYKIVLREYYEHLRFWNHAIDAMKIDVYISRDMPHSAPTAVIGHLCRLRKIPVVAWHYSSIPENGYIGDTGQDISLRIRMTQEKLREKYANAAASEIPLTPKYEEYWQRFHLEPADSTPSQVALTAENDGSLHAIVDGFRKILSKRSQSARKTGLYVDYLYKYSMWRYWKCVYTRIGVIFLLIAGLFSFDIKRYRKIRDIFFHCKAYLEDEGLLRYYESLACRPAGGNGEKYVFVALHTEPENSVCPAGGVFSDQAFMVKMLSAHLPKGWWLYVKEHPGQISKSVQYSATRCPEFYEDICTLENVKIMHMNADSYALLDGCSALASVTGTMGFEAVNRGKPFFMFGELATKYAPGVFSIRSNHDCMQAMRCIEEEIFILPEKELRIFYKSLEECTSFGSWWFHSNLRHKFSDEEWSMAESNIIDAFVEKVQELYLDSVKA